MLPARWYLCNCSLHMQGAREMQKPSIRRAGIISYLLLTTFRQFAPVPPPLSHSSESHFTQTFNIFCYISLLRSLASWSQPGWRWRGCVVAAILGLCLINVDQSNSYQGCGELPPHKETPLQPHLLHTASILLFSALWSAVKPVLSLVNWLVQTNHALICSYQKN